MGSGKSFDFLPFRHNLDRHASVFMVCHLTNINLMEQPLKKANEKKKAKIKEANSFLKMVQKEFPHTPLTQQTLPQFLFKFAGFDYNPSTSTITKRPIAQSSWKEILVEGTRLDPKNLSVNKSNKYQVSLLENK